MGRHICDVGKGRGHGLVLRGRLGCQEGLPEAYVAPGREPVGTRSTRKRSVGAWHRLLYRPTGEQKGENTALGGRLALVDRCLGGGWGVQPS